MKRLIFPLIIVVALNCVQENSQYSDYPISAVTIS